MRREKLEREASWRVRAPMPGAEVDRPVVVKGAPVMGV